MRESLFPKECVTTKDSQEALACCMTFLVWVSVARDLCDACQPKSGRSSSLPMSSPKDHGVPEAHCLAGFSVRWEFVSCS